MNYQFPFDRLLIGVLLGLAFAGMISTLRHPVMAGGGSDISGIYSQVDGAHYQSPLWMR